MNAILFHFNDFARASALSVQNFRNSSTILFSERSVTLAPYESFVVSEKKNSLSDNETLVPSSQMVKTFIDAFRDIVRLFFFLLLHATLNSTLFIYL